MSLEPVRADTLVGAGTVESHGKRYAIADTAEGGVEVFRLEGEMAVRFGGAVDREAALRIVEDDATGRAQERANKFFAWLDETVDSVREGVSGPLLTAGYQVWHTGGGCMAWKRDLADGGHVLICTEDNGLDAAPDAADWIVGRYGKEDGFVVVQKPMALSDAISAGERLPALPDGSGETPELAFDSIEEALAGMEPSGIAPGR